MHPVSDIVMWYATGKPVEDNPLSRKLICKVTQINKRYRMQFQMLAQELEDVNLGVMWNEMFNDSVVTWGRIVTLIAFGSHLAKHYVSLTGSQDYAEEVAFRCREFFNDRLTDWVISQGGWQFMPDWS